MSGMSGSFPYTPEWNSCERLVIETVLVNPDIAILSNLNVNDILKIEIDSSIGVVAKTNEQMVGIISVESQKMDKLIECIDGGTVYNGVIISVDKSNGVCRIRISAV